MRDIVRRYRFFHDLMREWFGVISRGYVRGTCSDMASAMSMHVPLQFLISFSQLLISLCVFFHGSLGCLDFLHKTCFIKSCFLPKAILISSGFYSQSFLLGSSFLPNSFLLLLIFFICLLESSHGLHDLLQSWDLVPFKHLHPLPSVSSLCRVTRCFASQL